MTRIQLGREKCTPGKPPPQKKKKKGRKQQGTMSRKRLLRKERTKAEVTESE